MKKLELEFRNEFKKKQDTFQVGNTTIMMTPPLDEDYWVFRIVLHKEQALVAFPKFGTLGIGFAEEEDWNTNFPYTSDAKDTAKHIWKNRKYPEITKKILIEAIEVLRKASVYYKTHEEPETIESGDFNQFTQNIETLREKVGKKYS
ncbi:MAG: hypothetical protein ACTSRU_18595 [Candidatus Hodarchaeales archaeon]